ncbi:serine hydrolase domain-containing protein [Asticcacaulis benevestitus]|nr:serine hydrolase domain-containing protein [Asticcacaulis benevestitus]
MAAMDTRMKAKFFASIVATMAVFGAAQAQGVPDAARIDQVIQAHVAKHPFMGTVLVAKGGTVILDRAYGYASLETMAPMTTDTSFRIGSMTKQFTAAAILLLDERKMLKTGDLISSYLPNLPADWNAITVHDLLAHTSGIANFTSQPGYTTLQTHAVSPQDDLALIRDKPLDFRPGSRWAYSNTNYILLGMIIEKVSGQSYKDFVDVNLIRPVGMAETFVATGSGAPPLQANGYLEGKHGLEKAAYVDMSVPYAAGAMVSTTHDLLLWEKALFGGKVLSQATLVKMTTVYKSGYGYGLFIHPARERNTIEHAGNINGFNSAMAYYPNDDLIIIVLDNIEGTAADDIEGKIARLFSRAISDKMDAGG